MNQQKFDIFPPLSKTHLTELKKLKSKKYRKLEGRTLVEGKNLIEQLITNGLYPSELILSEPDESIVYPSKFSVYQAMNNEIGQLSDTETPQSMIAVYKIPELTLGKYRAVLYLDGIQDPGNLGTIFRSSAAFGLDGLVLSPYCCEVFSPKVIRASLGSVFWIPHVVADTGWLMEQEADLVGLKADADKKMDEYSAVKKPVIMVIGAEGTGIRKEVEAILHQCFCIPMSGKMESLNASVSAGIAAYILSQRLFLLT